MSNILCRVNCPSGSLPPCNMYPTTKLLCECDGGIVRCLMEAPLIHYLGNQRASLILITQTALPCVSHTVSHTSRLRLECVSNVYHNRNAANLQQYRRCMRVLTVLMLSKLTSC
jgi:dethiobiotin synthetase